jgi:hypothetical protein
METGKFHEKSKVFVSGIALINFLYCVYENDNAVRKDSKPSKPKSSSKGTIKDIK